MTSFTRDRDRGDEQIDPPSPARFAACYPTAPALAQDVAAALQAAGYAAALGQAGFTLTWPLVPAPAFVHVGHAALATAGTAWGIWPAQAQAQYHEWLTAYALVLHPAGYSTKLTQEPLDAPPALVVRRWPAVPLPLAPHPLHAERGFEWARPAPEDAPYTVGALLEVGGGLL